MKEISPKLFIGSEIDCRTGDNEWAIVHACKSPCHQRAVGYKGSLPRTHPNYLVKIRENDIYLNMIDPPGPLFMPPLFIEFMKFAKTHWENGKKILIHCNQGESRAPSLALLFMSKHLQIIDSTNYDLAKTQFIKLMPNYTPGHGIQTYLRQHWGEY